MHLIILFLKSRNPEDKILKVFYQLVPAIVGRVR